MKKASTPVFWTGLLLLGAILLWWAAIALGSAAGLPVAQGERLTFGIVVSLGMVAVTSFLSLRQPPWPSWLPLSGSAFRQIGLGVLAYAGLILIATGAAVLAGFVRIEFAPAPEAVQKAGYLLALVLLSEALPEELLFRGWLMQALAARRSPWPAIFGQAGLFTGFAWVMGGLGSLQDASFIFCFGLMLGVVRAATGSVWAPMGVHLAFITAQQAALPQWQIWSADPHWVAQTICLTLVPFSVVVALLFDRVRPQPDPG